MFGYIVTDREQLSQDDQKKYRAYYCGLCQALGKAHGKWGQAALNFDMTFLYILLSSLSDDDESVLQKRCLLHPLKKREMRHSDAADYCADMTVLLAYYNALDDWNDDHKRSRLFFARRLEESALAAAERYPRQAKAITENIDNINTLEREKEIHLDAVANCFGEMMGEVFVPNESVWAKKLRSLGQNLGKFIYFMDAYEDAEKDAKHKNYNPLLPLKDDADYEQKCKDILMMFLGQAAQNFEALPIVENTEILRNILYAGVWSRFQGRNK